MYVSHWSNSDAKSQTADSGSADSAGWLIVAVAEFAAGFEVLDRRIHHGSVDYVRNLVLVPVDIGDYSSAYYSDLGSMKKSNSLQEIINLHLSKTPNKRAIRTSWCNSSQPTILWNNRWTSRDCMCFPSENLHFILFFICSGRFHYIIWYARRQAPRMIVEWLSCLFLKPLQDRLETSKHLDPSQKKKRKKIKIIKHIEGSLSPPRGFRREEYQIVNIICSWSRTKLKSKIGSRNSPETWQPSHRSWLHAQITHMHDPVRPWRYGQLDIAWIHVLQPMPAWPVKYKAVSEKVR